MWTGLKGPRKYFSNYTVFLSDVLVQPVPERGRLGTRNLMCTKSDFFHPHVTEIICLLIKLQKNCSESPCCSFDPSHMSLKI